MADAGQSLCPSKFPSSRRHLGMEAPSAPRRGGWASWWDGDVTGSSFEAAVGEASPQVKHPGISPYQTNLDRRPCDANPQRPGSNEGRAWTLRSVENVAMTERRMTLSRGRLRSIHGPAGSELETPSPPFPPFFSSVALGFQFGFRR
jgi:hypothetical protein